MNALQKATKKMGRAIDTLNKLDAAREQAATEAGEAIRDFQKAFSEAYGTTAPKVATRRRKAKGTQKKDIISTAHRVGIPTTPNVDWVKVLGKIPQRFTVTDVKKASRQNPGAALAIARWVRSGAAARSKVNGVFIKS